VEKDNGMERRLAAVRRTACSCSSGASVVVSLPIYWGINVTGEPATVFVVDDDSNILSALTRLLSAAGYRVRAFRSSQDFLAAHDAATPGCILLDLAMPGLSGFELQRKLRASGCQRPIVFVSGHGDVPRSASAMEAEAVDFLTKPVSAEDLLAAINRAIERDHAMRRERAERRRSESGSPR
jgi:FixJ family two-component response regulator